MGWLIREQFQGFALTARSMAAFERLLSELAVTGSSTFKRCESGEKTKFKSKTTNMAAEVE